MPSRLLSRLRTLHYAWIVVAITFATVLTGAGIRAAPSVLILPLEAEFGWSRGAIASAIGLRHVLPLHTNSRLYVVPSTRDAPLPDIDSDP